MQSEFEGVQDQLAHVNNRVAQLRALPLEKVTREGELGTANLSRLKPYFEYAQNLAKEVSELPLGLQPQNVIQNVERGIAEFWQLFTQAATFNLSPTERESEKDPIRRRDILVDQLREHFVSGCNHLLPVIAFLKSTAEKPLVGIEAQRKAEELLEDSKRVSEELHSLRESAKQAAQVAGAASYAVLFKDEADQHRKSCRWWLGWSAALTAAAVSLGWTILADLRAASDASGQQFDSNADWHFVAARAIVLSVLLYAAVWSTRNFSSHRHNEVINRHRHNALLTFEAFAKSTADDVTKSTVLVQATRCIFEHQPTGYLARGGANQAQTVFTEVLDRFGPRTRPN